MKGTALLLLCAVTLAQAEQPQLTLSGKVCNCNPGEAPKVCSQNGSDDQLVAHENCNQFYKCFDGSAVAYDCPDKLLYNPLAEICDWPENVECGERPITAPGTENEDCSQEDANTGNEGNGEQDNSGGNNGATCNCNPEEAPALCAANGSNGVLVAHQNCNQFYKCDHGIPVTLNCPSGLLYNPYTEQCDWDHNVECGDRPIVEIDGGGDNGGDEDCDLNGNGNGESGSGGGSGGNEDTCNCNPGEAPSICAADGSDGVLVAHENCNQFYKCDHGVPVVLNCPPDLLYNPYTKQCDWVHNVDCGDRPIVEIDGGGNDGNEDGGDTGGGNGDSGGGNGDTGGSGENGSSCNCNPDEAPGICSTDGSDGTLVAHENCNQFYKCAHGMPVTINCPPGLVYNPYIECCDWPYNVDCGDKPIIEIDGGGNGGSGGDSGSGGGNEDNGTGGGNGGNSNEDNGSSCNCNPEDAPGICATDGADGTLVAHENCNQFYKCAHGIPVTINCPPGLVYNPYIECCDWPANVDCGDKPIVDVDGGGNGDNGSEGGNGDSGTGGGSGDNGGGNSNEDNEGTCNCNPEDAPGICSTDGSDGTLVAHENCNQFYKCAHGVPVTINCPPGLVYNPYIECCDWPHNVNCGDKPIIEIDGGGNGESDGDSGSGGGNGDNGTGGGNGGNSNEDTGSSCNCNPEDAPGICTTDGSDGTLIAHENCNQFYKCAHGTPVTITCPPGLVYNPYIECCDWPANVDCGNKPIVEVDGGGNGDNGGGDNGGGDNGGGDNGGGDNGGGDNGGTCNCNPGEAPGICGSAGSDGTLIAHENCNQFYKCAHGVPVAQSCYPGLLYNPYTERCDWPALVECGDRPIVEGGEGGNGDNGGGDNGGGDNGGGDNGGGDNGGGDNGGTCNCNPGEAPGICGSAGSDGTLIAHENCNQFYKCAHGVPVAQSCYPGLLYNPHTERCDWPALVECGDRPIVEGGEGGNGDNGGGDNGGGDNGGGDNGGGDNGGGDNGGTCNCNPGEAPGICGSAGSDGTLIAHENCNQFYKCAHGVPVAQSCYPGLLYNPHTERCDWPALVECGDRPIVEGGEGGNGDNGGGDNGGGDNGGGDNGGGDNGGGDNGGTCNCNPGEAPGICGSAGSDGTLIAHENCNQFYKCAHGVPVAQSCYPGLLYNPHTERCDWPALVECGDRPIVEGGEGGNGDNGGGDNGGGDNGGGDNGGGDNGGGDNGGTCNCNPGEAPGICGSAGSDGTLIAHENCNQFYKCAHGVPVAQSCYPGLLYNPHTERCDWPALVECGERPIVEGGEGGNGDNGGGDNGGGDNGGGDNGGGDNGGSDNGGTCNCNPGEAPGICGSAGSDGTLIAHENCNQFYKCAHGVPVAQSCYPGLLYNPHTERCDWPTLVECGDRPIVEGGEGGNGDNGGGDNGGGDNGGGDNGGGDNGGGDNGGTCNCNPGEAPGICGSAGSDGTLIAHENCNQFYKCAHGVPVAQSCYPGLLYNPHTERCDWPALVECGDRPIVEGGEGGNGDNGGGDNGGGDNGGGDNGGGDNGGGDNGGTCNCNPGEAPGICGSAGSDGTLIAHENCNQFYKCAHGVPVAQSCYPGLLYNPHTERCDWPALVECGDRPIVEGGEGGNGDNGGGDNGGGDNGGGDNGGGDNGGGDNGGTCNCNPGEAPGICGSAGSDGTLIAHENCNQFYKCAHGVPVAQSCYPGLLYNPHTERCDWPALVECGDRPIVEGGEGGNGDNGGGDNGGGDNGGGDNGGGDDGGGDNGGTCNCNPGEAPGICGSAGSDGTLIAHENCNQFYKCAHGVPVAQSCYPGLLYNPHTERCDWPALVECGDRPIVEGGEGGNGDNGGGDNGGGDNGSGDNGGGDNGSDNNGGNCDPSEAPAICASAGSNGVLVAHENCSQFYVCSYGKPVALNCPNNLLYNTVTEECDWPRNVDCGDRVVPEPESGGDDGTCSCNAREAPSICAGTRSNGKLIAHENCNQYYVCFEGTPVARSCPQSLFYDPHTEQCLWPTSVSCEGRVITSISTYTSLNKHTQGRRRFF